MKSFLINFTGFILGIIGAIVIVLLSGGEDAPGWIWILASLAWWTAFSFFTSKYGFKVTAIQYSVLLLGFVASVIAGGFVIGYIAMPDDHSEKPYQAWVILIGVLLMFFPLFFLKSRSDKFLARKYVQRNSPLEKLFYGLRRDKTSKITIMGDQYNVNQAGAVGPNAHADHFTMNQTLPVNTDYGVLADELASLRKILLAKANGPVHYRAITEISAAEEAAKDKDGSKVLSFLKSAGSWAWEQIKEVGPGILATIVKAHFGAA